MRKKGKTEINKNLNKNGITINNYNFVFEFFVNLISKNSFHRIINFSENSRECLGCPKEHAADRQYSAGQKIL